MPEGHANPPPRYLELAGLIGRDIEAGSYPVGSLLPTERELCGTHACSRHTAREALRILVDRGLITRRRGSGSVVVGTTPAGRYVQTIDSLNELIRYSADARFVLSGRSTHTAGAAMVRDWGVPRGSAWIRFEGLRRTGEDVPPLCWTVIDLAQRFGALGDEIGRRAVPVYVMIEERFGERVVEVAQTVDAVAVSRKIARALECRSGAPALKTTRRYIGESRQMLMIAESVHPAGRTQFKTTLRRSPRT
jgi:GntR family transcriptional regulator